MANKVLLTLILVFSILLLTGTVYGGDVKNTDSTKSNTSSSTITSKSFKVTPNIIKQVSVSSSTFKSGTTIKIKVSTSKSAKSVSANIQGKGTFKLKKNKNSIWYYNLKTKNYKTGRYKLNIKAVDYKKKVHKKHTYLNVDNVAPKIKSLNSNVTTITAGNPFYIEVITDKKSKKVLGKVRGITLSFKHNPIAANCNGYNSSNSKNWTYIGKISYKEIGKLNINVEVSDSLGNTVKRTTSIKSTPRYVYWNGTLLSNNPTKVYYSNPIDAYQRSINELNKYVTVYEGNAGNKYTLGITYNNGYKATKVVIAYKDPFVVYHEMAHVLNWQWSEYQCDLYAYKKVGYWIQ